jgi:hypothetical protein
MVKPYKAARHDYGTIYQVGGAAALNEVLLKRYPDEEVRLHEIEAMPRRGGWIIEYAPQTGMPFVVGRKVRGSRPDAKAHSADESH